MKDLFTWISKSKEIEPTQNTNPWAGLAAYEDPETAGVSLTFYGRDDESYDVAKLISNNIIVTIYGKSGVGKTSLLNAGVFPELRCENFFPISIRLGIRDNSNGTISLQDKIITSLEGVIENIEEIDVIEPQCDNQASDFLWNYFARHRFFSSNGEELIPVMVFDQFEELFNSSRREAENLLCQLDYINDRDHFLDNCEVNGIKYHYETNYRFVLSIREDDLYKLEDSIDNCLLPALKRCRYRLHGLSYKGAKEVILMPCREIQIFHKENEDPIADKIINICSGGDKNINTLMLSLICYVLYNEYMARNKAIQVYDLDGYKNIIQEYYLNLMEHIPEKQRKYLEDNLVDEQGRRKTIYLSDLIKNAPAAETFTTSLSARILNVNDGQVELVHDQLAAIVHSFRSQRLDDQRTRSLAVSLFSYYIIASYFIWHIIITILHASWATYSLWTMKTDLLKQILSEYISRIAVNMSVDDVSIASAYVILLSQIIANILLIYLIGYELPKKVCEYFYEILNIRSLCTVIVAIIISAILGTNWFFCQSISANPITLPITGWIVLCVISTLIYYKKNNNEKTK